MKRIIRKVPRGHLVAIPPSIIEILKAKEGDFIVYKILRNGTIKIELEKGKGDKKQ